MPTDGRDLCNVFVPGNVFYKLCFKASNEVAKKFQDIVCDEILPSIRKHGLYATTETLEDMLNSPDFTIKVLTKLKEEQEKNSSLLIEKEKNIPKIKFADAVETSENSVLIGVLAKILKQNGCEVGQNRLFDWLRLNSFLIKGGSGKTCRLKNRWTWGYLRSKNQ